MLVRNSDKLSAFSYFACDLMSCISISLVPPRSPTCISICGQLKTSTNYSLSTQHTSLDKLLPFSFRTFCWANYSLFCSEHFIGQITPFFTQNISLGKLLPFSLRTIIFTGQITFPFSLRTFPWLISGT